MKLNVLVLLLFVVIFIVKARFLIENVTEYMRTRNEDFGLYLYSAAHKFDLGYTYTPLPSYPKSEEEIIEIMKKNEESMSMGFVKSFYDLRCC